MGRGSIIIICGVFLCLPCPVENCKERVFLTNTTGIISDGDQKYPPYARCEWLIDAQSPNKTISLEFEFLNTECSYDFLFIFDGHSYTDPMLASLSGDNLPDPIIATSGKMLVYLFSDRNYERMGFKAGYSIQDCPHNCSNFGNCVDHRCKCFPGRAGITCNMEMCPNNCGEHGHCVVNENATHAYCECDKGFTGYMCNISLNDAEGSEYWYDVAPAGTGFESRSAHAGTLVPQNNCLYIFGGYTLNSIAKDLMRYCLDVNQWEAVPEAQTWPSGRYEHAIAQYGEGFYMYGGILDSGHYSNELWYFNTTTVEWTLCAVNSTIQPLQLSGHTLTVVEEDIYLFGGKTSDGRFWSKIYKIKGNSAEEWQEVIPLGGKSSERRLVGHSTVYHKESKSLLIYGGYSHSQDQPRFGSHTNFLHLFHIENRIWSQVNYFVEGEGQNIPSQRSYHSAQIMGNYMIIYGGNTHIHRHLELCYDFDMYLYHLGCHTWVRIDHLMGKYTEVRETMKRQGRVSHVAAAAYGNILLVAGGYTGYVRGDLIAFKFPPYVAPPTSEAVLDLDFCVNYTRIDKCGYNPDCFYCNNITTTNKEGCMHRSQHKQCLGTTNYYPKAVCPGICGRLSTCLECLSQGQGATLEDQSPERWTYIQPCNWCVKEAKCQQRSKPEGTCLGMYNTMSGLEGWWGGTSSSLSQIDQCRLEDFPAGLQAIKYRPTINMSEPDEVYILRETDEIETFRHIYTQMGVWDRILWKGFIHPLNASIRLLINNNTIYTLKLVTENISVVVGLSRNASVGATETVVEMPKEASERKPNTKEFEYRHDNSWLFPNISRGNKYYLDMVGEYKYPKFSESMGLGNQMYKVEIQWNGQKLPANGARNYNPLSYEFLEPYSNGSCHQYATCLACMTDALCGWCDPADQCMLRNTSQVSGTQNGSVAVDQCIGPDKEKILITEPSVCPVCSDHVDCSSCTENSLCEWILDDVYCARRHRAKKVVQDPTLCPAICHQRKTCSLCLNVSSECAWCENLRTCLPFSDYVSRYRHGQCTEWIDSEVTSSTNKHTCRDCSAKHTCDECLDMFSCGWCGNTVNPTIGICFEGDYAGPYGNRTCSALVTERHNVTEPADWNYSMCPDVEECVLGLAKCHQNATCTNTFTSYTCTCNRGFDGDGINTCEKTCYHVCTHGECMEDGGEYFCDCNLGWTGVDCDTDCQCNGHSMCENGTGKCDFCLNSTTGPKCDQCLTGHFGDPSKPDGCFKCQCNKHGDKGRGWCHNETGECFCVDNTEGYNCERCQKDYYGDPREGGKCYLSCDHGLIIEQIKTGSVGSYQGPGVSTWKAYCLWIFTVSKDINKRWLLEGAPTITFGIEDLSVNCEKDHVYVYDGIPTFIDSEQSGILLGTYCGHYTGQFNSVVAKSGIVTVYFNANISHSVLSASHGFNGSYFVNVCPSECDTDSRQVCYNGQCVCKDGYKGYPNCTQKSCDQGCHFVKETRSCSCEGKFGSTPYQISIYPWDANPQLTIFHGNGPVSRYGHALIHCDDDLLYMFGGRSLEHGLLNDIWKYSFNTSTWSQIKPITSDQPSPRYFHAGACVPIMKNLYIFGGLVETQNHNMASKEMWKFAIDACKWTGPIEPDWMAGMAGHTMTRVEDTKLVIIGGFSASEYFSDKVYVYNANSYLTAWETQQNVSMAKPIGIYGHSAVYNEPTRTIYVYGGHAYKDETLKVSDHLFTYDVITHTWNILQPEPRSKLERRYFHTAVGFDDYMVILGGYTDHRNMSSNILIYKYKCNFWFTLSLTDTSAGKILTSLIGAAAVKYRDSMYIHGGLHNTAHNEIYQLQIPTDICMVHNTTDECKHQPGCSAVIVAQDGDNVTFCFSSGAAMPKNFIASFPGQPCNLNYHKERDCNKITNCSECVAVYPEFKNAKPSCFWCGNCLYGRCIPKDYVCEGSNKCEIHRYTSNMPANALPNSDCAVGMCIAATCQRCVEQGCVWTQNFRRRHTNSKGELVRQPSFNPENNWICVLTNIANQLPGYHQGMSPPRKCPAPCPTYRECHTCLASKGGEGGAQSCYWSVTLHECMPPAYLSLHCVGGGCGTVLEGEADRCPAPCSSHTKCADCRRAQGCGWCAYGGENGRGSCVKGTRSGPLEENMCKVNYRAFVEKKTDTTVRERVPDWTYATCPPEDECQNGHHNCDLDTQDCHDDLHGFRCKCKSGYIKKEEDGQSMCTPICHEGCVKGTCVKPDRCECNFGYVGTNCSTKCECNGHSMCESVAQKDICLQCRNNTQGVHCDECKPLYVGDPHNGGRCVSCTEFCNNHSDICLHWTELNNQNNNNAKQRIYDLLKQYPDTQSSDFIQKFKEHISSKGPKYKNNTFCMDCEHHTHKQRCQQCQSGYFRLSHMTNDEPCKKCMCNGHSDQCDSSSGLNCQCSNNTETRCNPDTKEEIKCHKLQCADCKEYFLGKPTDGHHCYRTMKVNQDYCFDPTTQADCLRGPGPLKQGRTVFYAVQPKYVNVDIRVTVDVTEGGIDVYFSAQESTFIVDVNKETGEHNVMLDTGTSINSLSGIGRKRRSLINTTSNGDIVIRKVRAKDINTFITVNRPETLLVIKDVRTRLVITLPNEKLDLKTSRFYMVFVSKGDGFINQTIGNLYFRQDQPHIDLFVFFSVFFSCFFLFLAICVLLWKTKQGFDARRTRQQRAREMLHMASRPFAKVLVLVEHPVTPYNVSPNVRLKNRKLCDRTPLLPSETGIPMSPVVMRDSLNLNIVPIAIEPMDDGVAALGTVLLQLPGGMNAPSRLCLGSTLSKGYQLNTCGKQRRQANNSSTC